MIYKDDFLSNRIGYGIYRYKDDVGLKIICHNYFDTTDIYEDNEFMICEQEDDFYIMGASRNANYIGYKLNECDISNKELMEGNIYILINTYEKYEMKAFS